MPGRNFTDEEEAEIAKIYLAGNSAKSIMRAYGLSFHISIVAALRRQGVTQRTPAERNRLYAIDHNAFDVIDAETAYWWGFIYADGSVSKRSLSISLSSRDNGHLEKLKAFLKSEHPIHVYDAICKEKSYPQINYSATSKHLTERLVELGIVARRTNPSAVIDQLPDEFFSHWLRGFFDGDGSVSIRASNKQARIRFCGSKDLMMWIRKKLAIHCETNPDLKIRKHPKANICYLAYCGNLQVKMIRHFLYCNATVWLKRKHEIAFAVV